MPLHSFPFILSRLADLKGDLKAWESFSVAFPSNLNKAHKTVWKPLWIAQPGPPASSPSCQLVVWFILTDSSLTEWRPVWPTPPEPHRPNCLVLPVPLTHFYKFWSLTAQTLFSVSLEFSFSESHGPRKGSPDGSAARNRLQCRRRGDVGSVSGSGRSPGGGNGKPGKSHGQRSLGGYSPWGHRESDAAERGSRKLSEVAQDCGPWKWQAEQTEKQAAHMMTSCHLVSLNNRMIPHQPGSILPSGASSPSTSPCPEFCRWPCHAYTVSVKIQPEHRSDQGRYQWAKIPGV